MRIGITAFAVAVLLAGCSQVAKIPDDQIAQDLGVAARAAVKYTLQAAVRKYPADASRIAADATTGNGILKSTVIPAFNGASSADVLVSVVNTTLTQLKSKITNANVIAALDAGLEVLLVNVTLPKNPAAKLDARTLKIVNSVLSQISNGIEDVFPPSTTPAPTPAPVPVPQK